MAPEEKPRRAARIAAVLLLLVIAFVVFMGQSGSKDLPPVTEAPPAPAEDASAAHPWPEPAPPHPSFVALLDGLGTGQTVGSFRVADFRPLHDGFLWLKLEHEKGEVYIGIAAKNFSKYPPPIQTDGYDIIFAGVGPQPTSLHQGEITPALEDLARRIRKNEGAMPRPIGL